MYRIMIVDDEPLILAGIASMLDWEALGCRIVLKAANGQQALAVMEEQKPDIVITDIKMPGMDGISLMEQAGQEYVFILLTNLEEFGLARRALSLGAVDYLVKMELTEEKLAASLELAKERCDMKRRASQADSELLISPAQAALEYVRTLLSEGGSDGGGDKKQEAMAAEYLKEPVLVLINFNYGHESFTEDFTREDQKKVISFAENVIGQMVKGYFDRSCLVQRERDGLLLALSAAGQENHREMLRSMGEKIISVVKDYFEVSVCVTISQKKESITEFPELLYQVMTAAGYYYNHSSDPVVFYSEGCEESRRHTSSFNIGFLKKDLTQAVELNDSRGLEEILEQVASLLKEHSPSKQQAVNACANLYFFLSSFFEEEAEFPYEVNIMEKLGRFGNLDQILAWTSWFKEEIAGILRRRREAKPDRIAEQVREYVMEHYKERITLSQTAEALGMSQGYLSTAFKKQAGESFTSYVSEIKIEKAKELIGSRQYMMYEVSDLLGFDTPFYFSKVFKKVTGMSPKEFEAASYMKKV